MNIQIYFSGFLSRNGWIWAAVIVLIVAALAASNRKTKIELKANKMPLTDSEPKTQEQPNLQTDAEPKEVESEHADEPLVDPVSDHVRELELEMEQLRISLLKMQEVAADSALEKKRLEEAFNEKIENVKVQMMKEFQSHAESNSRLLEETVAKHSQWINATVSSSAASLDLLESQITEIESRLQNQEGYNEELASIVQAKIDQLEADIEELSIGRNHDIQEIIQTASDSSIDDQLTRIPLPDKTGMPDFALESAGGEILQEMTTRGLASSSAMIKIWNFPIFYHTMSARVAIQPDVNPGNCFAYGGGDGTLGVKLSHPIIIQNVTIEHIPKAIALSGSIDSAPKDFTVYGLSGNPNQWSTQELGRFTFEMDGTPTQTFNFENTKIFHGAKFHFQSNWGNEHHTCVYRVRVHGKHP